MAWSPLYQNLDRPNADIGVRPQRGGQVEAVLGRAERGRDGITKLKIVPYWRRVS
jgi:hypothetical protein